MRKTTQYNDSFRELIKQGMCDFLKSCSLDSTNVTVIPRLIQVIDNSSLGVINFTGEKIRGTLAIQADDKFLKLTDPLKRDSLAIDERVAWLQEMVNRIMGIIKGHMASHAVVVQTGLPSAVVGEKIAFADSAMVAIETIHVRSSTSECWLFYGALIDSSVSFEGIPDEDSIIGSSGESFMFK